MSWTKNLIATTVILFAAGNAQANVFITEWMYNPGPWEFVEFTNIGPGSVDMTGWSYSDDSVEPGSVDLSAYGIVAEGESVILTEAPAEDFRTEFGLSALVKIIGDNTDNLGRNDAIYLFDDTDAIADVLDFGDEEFPGSIRTQNPSGVPEHHNRLGSNNPYYWKYSALGDEYGSYLSETFILANPGTYTAIVPEPGTIVLMVLGVVGLGLARRRR